MNPNIDQRSIQDIIRQRFSCRNYREEPIPEAIKELLIQYVDQIKPGPFGVSSRFRLAVASAGDRQALRSLGTYGFIKGATGFLIGAMPAGERNLEDFGYQMESIILYATRLGLGTCWLGGTFTKSSFAEKLPPQKNELIPAVVAVGNSAGKKRTLERIIRSRAEADRRIPWGQLFFNRKFDQPLPAESAGEYSLPLEMVRLGPSASNNQPWRVVKDGDKWHFYLQRTPGYRERMLVRLFTVADMQRIDMGIAMCHFELTAKDLGLVGCWTVQNPNLSQLQPPAEYLASWVGT